MTALTAAEAAEFLKISTRTVMRLARNGQLPGARIGREWRFLEEDLRCHFTKGPTAKSGGRPSQLVANAYVSQLANMIAAKRRESMTDSKRSSTVRRY